MAAPTFTSISPAIGHTGGKYLAMIEGGDFELHPGPPASGKTDGVLLPSMEIEVNGRLAEDVKVFTTSKLTCIVPGFKGDPSSIGTGAVVDLVLRNLGPPIEEITEVDAFIYRRTSLARGDDAGALNRIVRELLQEMRRQIIDNISINTNVDYDDSVGDSLSIVALGKAPGIALFGPMLRENRFYRTTEKPQIATATEYEKHRTPATDDLMFNAVLVASDDPAEMMNLIQAFRLFFRNNPAMEIDAHPTDTSYGTRELELWLTNGPRTQGEANRDNLLLARAAFEFRGIPLDEDDWKRVEWGKVMSDPPDIEVDFEQKE